MPIASRKRLLLAVYLDYLLFGAPWAIVIWWLSAIVPALGREPWYLKLLFFAALETMALRLVAWSPGYALLGITPLTPSTGRPVYAVDPRVKAGECWWTMAFGVLLILDGAKSISRWTLWSPPAPFFGIQPGPVSSAVVSIGLGALGLAVGAAALRLSPHLLSLGIAQTAIFSLSSLLSWSLWPAWIRDYIIARRAYQGGDVRPGEIEFMTALYPIGVVVLGVAMMAWLLLVVARIRGARRALPRNVDPSGAWGQ